MKRHLVFDLDGTLVHSLPGIAQALNRSLEKLGLPTHPQHEVRLMIGRGAANLCAAAIGYADAADAPADLLEAVHNGFRKEYPNCWQGAMTRVYPGLSIMLHRLAAEGAKMAVLSNKPHDVTLPMVQTLFPTIPFNPIQGFTGEFPRKPDPAAILHIAGLWGITAADITLVGDSMYDARTARNAQCPCMLVAWGYSKVRDLMDSGLPVYGSVEALEQALLD